MIEQQSNRCEKINASDESDCINWNVEELLQEWSTNFERFETWENREEGLVACDSMIRLLFSLV